MGLARGFRLPCGPSEEWSCDGILWGVCGVSVDTQMALGDDDVGRYDTLRRGERPRASYTFRTRLDRWRRGRASQRGVGWASITVSQRHSGIHRHPHIMLARLHSSDGPGCLEVEKSKE